MRRASRDESSITIAILAGGAGSRLGGVDKGLRVLDGRPLIEWVIDALPPVTDVQRVIVANRSLNQYAAYANVICDQRSGFAGPLAGIAAGLTHCSTAWLLTLPVDCPCPPKDLHELLLRAAIANSADAVVVHDGEQRQPLFALYRRELATSAAQALDADYGVWKWQDLIPADELTLPGRAAAWLNLNTAEDFAAFTENWHAGS